MAVLFMSEPPTLSQSAKYGDYKNWLLDNFYYYLCSYWIEAGPGPDRQRSAWNIALLKLDLPYREEARKQLCDAVSVCNRLITAMEGGATGQDRDAFQAALTHLLAELRKQRLFFTVHDVPIPPAVATLLDGAG